ncbi:uncharacterized protein F4812DRAFT_207565 [Daldinia caldariorum]|uniref:uncharacterized protein n=1 Tax=Daldinia caldariorum TaxID=326644 RepID=UPI0020074904|nr:uncharacterized protein F4812DRAFT_207565 [Daldinia caldariorum]KAI1464323.1 hypothetical protein F4812DRAFT_207565 [Daldinia caldariorum]
MYKSLGDSYQTATLPKGRTMSTRRVDVAICTYQDCPTDGTVTRWFGSLDYGFVNQVVRPQPTCQGPVEIIVVTQREKWQDVPRLAALYIRLWPPERSTGPYRNIACGDVSSIYHHDHQQYVSSEESPALCALFSKLNMLSTIFFNFVVMVIFELYLRYLGTLGSNS